MVPIYPRDPSHSVNFSFPWFILISEEFEPSIQGFPSRKAQCSQFILLFIQLFIINIYTFWDSGAMKVKKSSATEPLRYQRLNSWWEDCVSFHLNSERDFSITCYFAWINDFQIYCIYHAYHFFKGCPRYSAL